MTDTMEYAIKTYGTHLWDSTEQCIELCAVSSGCSESYYILYNSDEGKEAVSLLQEFCRLHYFNPNIDVTDCSNYNFIFNCKIDTFIHIFRSHSIWDIIRYNLPIPAEWSHNILKEHEIVSNTVFKISLKNTRKLRNILEIDLEKSLDTYKEFLKQNTTDKYSIDIWYIGNIPSYKCENNEKQIVLKMLQEALETSKIISVDDRFENKEAFGCMWFMVVLEKTYFKELSLKYGFFKYNDIIHDEKGYISIGFELPLEDNENIINDKENNMENNEIKVTDKVMNEIATEAITDTNNIVDNFNKDSDTIFEKEMPISNEKNINRYPNSFAKAMCNTITSIEVIINRLNNEGVSDRVYKVITDEQKLSMLMVLNKIFDYSFGKEHKKVFTVSYSQFISYFKEYVDFNNMYDETRIFRDFDMTRDVINIIVIEDIKENVNETIIDNDTFVMNIPSFKDLDYSEVKFEDVQNIEQKLTKKVCEILGKNVKLNAKEHDLWDKILKLEDEGNANPELKAELGHVLDLYFNTVDLQNLMRCKYDNLLIECLAYKAAYKELKDLIYNELDEK